MRPRSRLQLTLIALVLAGLFVIFGNAAADLVLDRRPLEDGTLGFIDAPDVAIIHLVFTGMPFFTLAVCAEPRVKLWTAAVVFTLVSWCYSTWQVWRDSLNDFAGGANIGAGLVMIVAPLAASVILAAISTKSKRESE